MREKREASLGATVGWVLALELSRDMLAYLAPLGQQAALAIREAIAACIVGGGEKWTHEYERGKGSRFGHDSRLGISSRSRAFAVDDSSFGC
jgi:hypothetical protein